jgi:hypothetical protein
MEIKKTLVFVLYDSVTNSVFQSQVLAPTIKKLERNDFSSATIISFEQNIKKAENTLKPITIPPSVKIRLLPRLPFLGKPSLWLSVFQLKKELKILKPTTIIARGPLAGWIAKRTNLTAANLTIQARGLAAAENRFVCKENKCFLLKHFLHKIRDYFLEQIEHETFEHDAFKCGNSNQRIESVSPALSNYLVTEFGASKERITIATDDIPKKISETKRLFWRKEIREKLKISPAAKVYCYSGSAKPWQCIYETIEHFKNKQKEDPTSVLLILSQDKEIFEKKLKTTQIKSENFRIISVKPTELAKFLCAADIGILMRKKDVINFVSRPTKALEYLSSGLKIEHNGTVDYLNK